MAAGGRCYGIAAFRRGVPNMSKAERIYIALGVLTVVIAGLTFWVAILHEQEHRSDLPTRVGVVIVALIYLGGGAYAVYRNLKGAKRADILRAEIVTIRDEHETQAEAVR